VAEAYWVSSHSSFCDGPRLRNSLSPANCKTRDQGRLLVWSAEEMAGFLRQACKAAWSQPVFAAMGYRRKGGIGHLFLKGIVVLSLLPMAIPSLGANPRTQEKEARKACLTGDYAKGVSILADMFVEDGNPVRIFNQGRCYEQNQRYQDAIGKFDEYLRIAGAKVTPDIRTKVEDHIADCRERLQRERIDSTVQPSAPVASVVAPTPVEPVPLPMLVKPNSGVDQPASPPAAGQHRWGLVTAGIVTGVVGAGGIVAGVIFNLKANSAAKALETKVDAYPSSSKDQKDFRTYAWIGYGIGAACLAAGTAMVAFGAVSSRPGSSTELSLVPAPGPSQLGAMLTGGF
jgi:hypothetical protein